VQSRWSLRRARALVGSKFLLIGGLVGFVLVSWLVELVLGLDHPIHPGSLFSIPIAIIPAGLWLGFFYLWDRHEPEPKHFVAGVSALGALVAAPLAEFVLAQAVPSAALAQQSLSPWSLDRLVYAILVIGLAQELCKYTVVRYTIYLSREFDEPMDGVVYMMAAGTGFAVWLNYRELSRLDGVFLSTATANAVVTTLVHASVAGWLGYVMGRAKFSRRRAPVRGLLLMLGLLGAAALNGQFGLVEIWLDPSGVAAHPWRNIAFAAGLASAVFAGLMLASQRLLAASPFRVADGAKSPDEAAKDPKRLSSIRAATAPPTGTALTTTGSFRAPTAPSSGGASTTRAATSPAEPRRATTGVPTAEADAPRPSARLPTAQPRLSAEHPSASLLPDDAELSDDPVAIATMLLQRARADLAELRGHYHRHDIVVLFFALLLIVAAAAAHQALITPPSTTFSERGLSFQRSQGWLAPEPITPIAPRLIYRPEASAAPADRRDAPYHVAFTYIRDAAVRLEVLIDQKPAWSNIVTGLDLGRRTRWGELYRLESSGVKSIAGHDWLRTSFHYAHVSEKGDLPRVDHAVEYATVGRDRLYVISMYGNDSQVARIEETIAPTLRVETRTGAPLLPQEGRLREQLARHTIPAAVEKAFHSTVMVVVADLVDGQLRPRGGGSGVIVGQDGSIVTNFHVIHDKNGRLHDLFVIGRYLEPDRAPQLWCAGSPSRSKQQLELDLALIKCDLDLDGRNWNPAWLGQWPKMQNAPLGELEQGQRLWVLGYPDVGGGGLTASFGMVEGWTGEERGVGRDFIKTDASITHGNSGGPVVNDQGEFVGIATAFRTKVKVDGTIIETSKIGLVRPRSAASDLIAIAAAGWTPRENHNQVEFEPESIDAPAEGVRLETRILDADNDKPIADAMLMVLRPGVRTSAIDMNRLEDQVLSWGRSNSQGEVRLKQPVPVPGAYSVLVFAKGYAPLIGDQELRLTETTPPGYDPWGAVRLTR
jgi:protease PrsW